jgi:hypothetical protein
VPDGCGSGGQALVPGAHSGITGQKGAGRAPGRAVPGRFSRLPPCPGRPAGPIGHPPGTADRPLVPRSGNYRGTSGRRGTSGQLGLPKVSAEAGCSAQMGAVGLVGRMGPQWPRCVRLRAAVASLRASAGRSGFAVRVRGPHGAGENGNTQPYPDIDPADLATSSSQRRQTGRAEGRRRTPASQHR